MLLRFFHMLLRFFHMLLRFVTHSLSVIQKYQGKRRNEMPPHLFAIADNAYRNMLQGTEVILYKFCSL